MAARRFFLFRIGGDGLASADRRAMPPRRERMRTPCLARFDHWFRKSAGNLRLASRRSGLSYKPSPRRLIIHSRCWVGAVLFKRNGMPRFKAVFAPVQRIRDSAVAEHPAPYHRGGPPVSDWLYQSLNLRSSGSNNEADDPAVEASLFPRAQGSYSRSTAWVFVAVVPNQPRSTPSRYSE